MTLDLRGMLVWDLCLFDEEGNPVDIDAEPASVLPALPQTHVVLTLRYTQVVRPTGLLS
jgi:hypothetical protein